MNDLKLFSFRRVIISSLVLGIITILLLNSAIGNPSSNNSNDNNGIIKDTTTTEDSTMTSSTNSNSNEFITVTETATVKENDNFGQDVAQETVEDVGRLAPAKIFSLSSEDNDLRDYLSIGIFIVLISSLFFAIFYLFYSYIYNNKELTHYLNHSLNQSGFQHKISQLGKKWMVQTNTGKQFSMKLMGSRNLRMEIIMPTDTSLDPREFGFRSSNVSTITYCDLEVLPMRLQVVQLYFSNLE
ncbi:MAG: hypothetical protein HeimC2_20690 [Candidatus Heimdallarchaeota archaeon LC_2]|nr:MAG: hypothetical protein HeimC2_20690 [Candidatus Heimdallarchaeota archaeon LC_2]